MKRVLAFLVFGLLAVTAQAGELFTAGKDYQVLTTPGPVDDKSRIEVREFFWYGCPHCFRLEPFMVQWLKTKPADVNFVRTPAALNAQWEVNARGYYAVEAMGKLEATHQPLFYAIHEKRQTPFEQARLAAFYASLGVDTRNFNSLYNSFAVSGKVARAKQLAQTFRLTGVPAVVVAGKYVVSGEDGRVTAMVDYLIAKERATRKPKK